jgi:hypothetical protein
MRVLLVATFSSAVETETRRHRRDRLEAAFPPLGGVPPGNARIVRARGAGADLRTALGRTVVAHETIGVADIETRFTRHSTRSSVRGGHLGSNASKRATNFAAPVSEGTGPGNFVRFFFTLSKPESNQRP